MIFIHNYLIFHFLKVSSLDFGICSSTYKKLVSIVIIVMNKIRILT